MPILGAEEEEIREDLINNIVDYRTISYVTKGILNINMIPGLGGYPNLTLVHYYRSTQPPPFCRFCGRSGKSIYIYNTKYTHIHSADTIK